jgi:hypothetical protein
MMQRGSLAMVSRTKAPGVWQFRWSEKDLHGVRVQRKRVIGSVERYPNETAARSAVTVLLAEINSDKVRMGSRSITMAQLCDHFEQRELAWDNTWRSYATKKTYQAYLTRWIRPHWRHYELAEIRTIQVESWLRTLPLAKSSCARVIDFQVEYAQSLIDDFSIPSRAPHIAISVDMLDTGIDIPEIVNLVFFKMVRSRTKFWQMVGRGTRLRPDLLGPGRHKREFWIFDYCQNLEFFSQNLGTTSGATNESLSKKLLAGRVELIAELDKHDVAVATGSLRGEVAERLRQEVAHMNVNNFIVRPKRRLVEKYADATAWETLGLDERNELVGDVAGLPSELVDEDLAIARGETIRFTDVAPPAWSIAARTVVYPME